MLKLCVSVAFIAVQLISSELRLNSQIINLTQVLIRLISTNADIRSKSSMIIFCNRKK